MPHRLALPIVLSIALGLLPACFRIDHSSRAVPPSTAVPPALLGEWIGTWEGLPDTSGAVRLTVQELASEPLLRVESDNPCLLPQTFTLFVSATHLELRGSAGSVFAADLDPVGRVLRGTWSCGERHGGWSASWRRELGAIGDISGAWIGHATLTLPLVRTEPIALRLQQGLLGGVLRVTGRVSVPGVIGDMGIDDGEVVWDQGRFEMVLLTDRLETPVVLLAGSGNGQNLVIDDGQLVASTPAGGLLGVGTWRALWTGR